MNLRHLPSRHLTPPPASFDGTLSDLYTSFIEPNLPTPADVEHLHRRLVAYCGEADPVFVTRLVKGQVRGDVYTTDAGHRLKPSDNSPAWWMHFVAFNGIGDADFSQIPTHMFQVAKLVPNHINRAGWYVAHILSAKDRNVDWKVWSREELTRRFLRNVHPCNCFYIPLPDSRRYEGDPTVIGFFAAEYAKRYTTVWEEFLRLTGGVSPATGVPPRYVYDASRESQKSVAKASSGNDAAASYAYSRLCFKADVIESLRSEDSFKVITPVGTFCMTKEQFYRDFGRVVTSKSYREAAVYHYPKPPQIALKYRV